MAIITRRTAVALLVLLALSLSGCWSRRELNTLGIVGFVGVDTSNTGIKTTFEIIKPEKTGKGGGEKSETPVKYVQSNGQTVIDTIRDSSLRFDRKLFLSQAKGFLFSEEIAKNGLAKHLDAILRYPEMRVSMHLVIIKDASAADIMNIVSGINVIPANYIEDLLRQYKVHSTSIDSKVIDFLKAYADKGINPIVTVLKKVKKDKVGKGDSEGYELTPEGSAVFLKDRLIGYLDGQETRGYNWVMGKVVSGTITFPTPNSTAMTAVEILHAESDREVELNGKDVTIRVRIKMTGMLDEQTNSGNWSDISALLVTVDQATAQSIQREVEHTLLKVQKEYQSDVFGFGQHVHRKYPKEWRNMRDNWDQLFSQADIEVQVQAKVTKTGKSSYSVEQ